MSEQRKSSGLLGAGITLPSHSPSSTFRMQPQHHEKRPLKSIFDIKFQDERSQRKKGVASLYVRAIESSSSIEREQRHHLLNSLQQQKSSRTQNNSYSSVNGNDQSIGDSIQSGRRSIYSLYSTIPKSSYFTDHEVSLFRVGEALVNLKLTDICLRRDEVFSTTEASAFFISELHIAITPAELRNFYERYPSRSGSPGVIDKSKSIVYIFLRVYTN